MMKTLIPANVCRFNRLVRVVAAVCLSWAAFTADVARGAIIDITASSNATVLRSGGGDDDQSEAQTLATKRLNDTNTRLSYLRFDMPVGLDAGDITSATLRLQFTTHSGTTTVTGDTVRVLGLNDGATNVGGEVTEGNWTDTMVWLTQPARGTSPDDITNTSGALPNAHTTGVLGTASVTIVPDPDPRPPAVVIDVPLNLADFQTFVGADTNDQVTLLFHNVNNVIISWASITNTGGHLAPTLRLEATAIPEPGSAALVLVGGVLALSRRQRRV